MDTATTLIFGSPTCRQPRAASPCASMDYRVDGVGDRGGIIGRVGGAWWKRIDSCGRPQKLVKLELNTGIVVELYVHKMAQDDCLGKVLPRKRVLVAGEDPGDPKKLKTEQNSKAETMANSNKCCYHLREIERLKQELRSKDFEISKLSKMVSKYRTDKKKKR